VSWTDVVGVKGVRDAKESVSCEVSVCEMVSRRSSRSGRFVRRRCSGSLQWRGAYKACHRRNDESLSGSGRDSC